MYIRKKSILIIDEEFKADYSLIELFKKETGWDVGYGFTSIDEVVCYIRNGFSIDLVIIEPVMTLQKHNFNRIRNFEL